MPNDFNRLYPMAASSRAAHDLGAAGCCGGVPTLPDPSFGRLIPGVGYLWDQVHQRYIPGGAAWLWQA